MTKLWLFLSMLQSPDVTMLDFLLRSGLMSPERAVELYCTQESTDKQHDALCSCPEDAVKRIYEKLGRSPTS